MRFSLIVVTLALAAFAVSCKAGEEAPPPEPSGAAPAVVPAPRDLVAEIVVKQPEAVWRRAREWMGPSGLMMPGGLGMLVAGVLGLPPLAAGLIDGRVPVVAALVEDDAGGPSLVVGVHLTSGREWIARLTTGAKAKFRGRLDAATGVTLLEPVGGPGEISLAVLDHYLLLARTSGALTRVGPYVATTLPSLEGHSATVSVRATRAAVGGGLARMIRRAWAFYRGELERADAASRAQRGGRAPDFGEPTAVIVALSGIVDEAVGVLESAGEARASLEPLGDYPSAVLELVPGKAGAARDLISDLSIGALEPLLALPQTVTVGVLSRAPKESARTIQSVTERVASVFGPRLDVEGRRRIERVVSHWVTGLGDPIVYGLVDRGAPALFVQAPIADAEVLGRLAEEIEGVLRTRAVADPLEALVGKMRLQRSKPSLLMGEDFAHRMRIELRPPVKAPSDPIAPALEATWFGKEGRFVGVVTLGSGVSTLRAFAESRLRLSDQAEVAALARAAKPAALAAVLQLEESSSASPRAVLVSLEREREVGRVRFGFSSDAARIVVRTILSP